MRLKGKTTTCEHDIREVWRPYIYKDKYLARICKKCKKEFKVPYKNMTIMNRRGEITQTPGKNSLLE